MKIVLIGTGNVASHLGPALKKAGHNIIQVYGRDRKSAAALSRKLRSKSAHKVEAIREDAGMYIIMLRDDAIASLLGKLTFVPSLIVHTSGSTRLDVFPKKMKNAGVLYPVQTFSKKNQNTPALIPFCIEATNTGALKSIKKIAMSVSPFVLEMKTGDREYVHLAAVFVNNFVNLLFTLAGKILNKKKIDFRILRPLIAETARKVQSGSPSEMQTGPAKRGDRSILREHMRLLHEFPEMKSIYSLLSKSIQKEYSRRT